MLRPQDPDRVVDELGKLSIHDLPDNVPFHREILMHSHVAEADDPAPGDAVVPGAKLRAQPVRRLADRGETLDDGPAGDLVGEPLLRGPAGDEPAGVLAGFDEVDR